jgi:membrane protein DedA with SNARE-associated domain
LMPEIITSISQSVVVFIRDYSFWAGPAAFVTSFAASVPGLNFFVPAALILVAAGVLVGAGLVSWWIVPWAAVGAILGTTLSYTIGVWIGPLAARKWPLKNHASQVERAQVLFQRYGFIAILGGYFAGPLRAPVAFAAGVAGMTRPRFEFANISSALLWTPFAVAEGAIFGGLLPPDHPLFLAVPFLAPTIAVGVSVALVAAWRLLRQTKPGAQP